MFGRRLAAALGALALAAFVLPLAPRAADEASAKDGLEVATFAAGCYWCVESDFDKVDGVVETTSGFTGGHTANPTYEEVGSGSTGHAESLLVKFDPKKVSYSQLLDHYWHHVDFLDGRGQFCDRGNQYRPAIFTHSPEQKKLAEESKAAIGRQFNKPIAVEIVDAQTFTPAEEYHQDYYNKNPLKYKFYRYSCGRDQRIAQIWESVGKAAEAGH
ncbi:MAG: peptide-methionine (S)-S-oxide reductase MsrA [Hyphomicrobium sp.]|jgi:peptide-methionine (S)-S-oxide reductase